MVEELVGGHSVKEVDPALNLERFCQTLEGVAQGPIAEEDEVRVGYRRRCADEQVAASILAQVSLVEDHWAAIVKADFGSKDPRRLDLAERWDVFDNDRSANVVMSCDVIRD
jgi:hypothetical protein